MCWSGLLAQEPIDSTPHAVQFVTVEPEVRLEVLDWGGAGTPLIVLAGSGAPRTVSTALLPSSQKGITSMALRAEDLAHPAILPQPTVIIQQITWAMMLSR
jgi:hypothetical protein